MLRITITKDEKRVTFSLEGKLSGLWITEMQDCWNREREESPDSTFLVDIGELLYADEKGKALLRAMALQGASLQATGSLNQKLVDDLTSPSCPREGSFRSVGMVFPILLLLFTLALTTSGLAAESSQETLRLTMQEAVQLALHQNPQVQLAVLNLAKSHQDQAIARSELLPQAGAFAAASVLHFNRDVVMGTHLPLLPKEAGPYQVLTGGAMVSVPILDLTLWQRWQASKQAGAAAGFQRSGVREKLTVMVVSQYLGCLRTAAMIQATQSRLDLAEALHRRARELVKEGVGTGLDELRAKVQLQQEKQRLLAVESAHRLALSGLARILSLSESKKIELTDTLHPPEFTPPTLEESLTTAKEKRPEWKLLEARSLQVDSLKKAADSARLPSLHADGVWAYQGLTLGQGTSSYLYQVRASVPLFTGGRIRAERAKAELEHKQIDQHLRELEDQIRFEIKTAMENMGTARREVNVAEEAVQLAGEELSQAKDRYEAGVAINLEVTTAQESLARANDSQIAALYKFNQALADWTFAVGQIETLYGNVR